MTTVIADVKPKINILTPTGNETVCVCYHDSYYDKEVGQFIPVIQRNADIIDALPHGSGIDCDWVIDVTKQSIRMSNSYHCMDDNGFYCGYADFTVIIPLSVRANHWQDYFKLQFHGDDSQYLNRKHGLREFLEEQISYALSQIFAYEIMAKGN